MIPKPGDVIRDRYTIQRMLGQSAIGVTALARDERGGDQVVVKLLSLEKMQNWKQFELFEREIAILKNLKHPNIPAYIDSFHLEAEKCIGLVQVFVNGADLDSRIRGGLRFTEERAVRFTCTLLEILSYLQAFNPPVIHRDINPKNIVMTGSGEPFLVDFDSVHSAAGRELFGSDTTVGTFGYMPMDQIMGKITPAVDMYALGVTLLFLLTHKRPEEFSLSESKLEYGEYLNVSRGFTDFIDRLIEPAAENRIPDGRSAIAFFEKTVIGMQGADGAAEPEFDDAGKSNPRIEEVIGKILDEHGLRGSGAKYTVKRVTARFIRQTSLEGMMEGASQEVEYVTDGKTIVHGSRSRVRRASRIEPPTTSEKRRNLVLAMGLIGIGAAILVVLVALTMILR